MGKKIYVNGGILINTRKFSCINATCLCDVIPEGAEIIDPPIVDGEKCLIIDDEHPQSPFYEYYCKTFFSTLYIGINYYSYQNDDCFKEFSEGIEESRKLLLLDVPNENDIRWAFLKMVYLHAVSCLDSFICSLVISKIIHDETLFIKYYKKLLSAHKKSELTDFLIMGKREEWENKVLEEVLHTSFCSIDTIKDSFKCLNVTTPISYNEVMDNHFKLRHLLMHRNGKRINGNRIELNNTIVNTAIEDVNNYGDYLLHCFQTPRDNAHNVDCEVR